MTELPVTLRCNSVACRIVLFKGLPVAPLSACPGCFTTGVVITPETEPARLEEIDRNARAYGWEVGRGRLMVDRLEDCDPSNPFLDPNWREHVQVPEKPEPRCGVQGCEQNHG